MWKLFGHHILNDLRHGIIGQWKKYGIACMIMILICFQYLPMLELVRKSGGVPISYGDYLLFVFKGMAIINPNDMALDINVFWLIYNFFIAFIVSYYPFKDITGYGQQILIRSQKRSFWWLGKCVWVLSSVLAYYLLTYLIISIFTLFSGGNFDIFPQYSIQSTDLPGIHTFYDLFLIGIVMPIVTSICLSLLQLLLSLIMKPILSIMVVLALLTFSIFICADWAIGNYTMVVRSSFMIEGGVNPVNGLIIMSALSIISVIAGLFVFKQKDIFSH